MKKLPMNELRDINIEAIDPKTVMSEVISKTINMKNITVMLFTKQYNYEEFANLINSTWLPEYHQHLKENNIRLELVVQKRQFEYEEKKTVKLQNKKGA